LATPQRRPKLAFCFGLVAAKEARTRLGHTGNVARRRVKRTTYPYLRHDASETARVEASTFTPAPLEGAGWGGGCSLRLRDMWLRADGVSINRFCSLRDFGWIEHPPPYPPPQGGREIRAPRTVLTVPNVRSEFANA
jgi:hypothetical protein